MPSLSNATIDKPHNRRCLSGGNLGYQLPNSVCRKEALAVNATRRNNNEQTQKKSSSKLGIIVGVVAGIVEVVVILGLLTLAIFRKSRRNTKTNIFDQVSVS